LLSISFSVAAEHVRHFQFRAFHAPRCSEVLGCSGCRLYRHWAR
jgi:hypothetical protein